MPKLACITRTFQAGKSLKDFDVDFFKRSVRDPIERILQMDSVNGPVIIVTNGDLNCKHREILSDGKLPSEYYLENSFHEEIISKKIIIKRCNKWGSNPGSATALNDGDEIAILNKANFVLHWSPEIELKNLCIHKALILMMSRSISVIGFARQRWWEKPQWIIPQNTAAIFNLEELLLINGLSQDCNNFGEITEESVLIKAREDVGDNLIKTIPIAGMEDFHAMLRMMKTNPKFKWGIIKDEPFKWNTSFEKGSERERNHFLKVFRQYIVMQEYAKKIFPEMQFHDVMDLFFGKIVTE